jgi:hypothetical protein
MNFHCQPIRSDANLFVPHSLKFWCYADTFFLKSRLKEESVSSDHIWKSIGSPADWTAYRHQLRRNEKYYANF